MLDSIKETRKLFIIEGLQNGRIDIKTSKYLLSLPENRQMEVLSANLKNLKMDLAKYENPKNTDQRSKDYDIDKVQLQLLIDVIEGLLDKV